jgi:hypothetical protein
MVQDILWKVDSHSACQTIACFLYGTQRFITLFTKACHWTLSWASWTQLSIFNILGSAKESVQIWGTSKHFITHYFFYSEGLFSPMPNLVQKLLDNIVTVLHFRWSCTANKLTNYQQDITCAWHSDLLEKSVNATSELIEKTQFCIHMSGKWHMSLWKYWYLFIQWQTVRSKTYAASSLVIPLAFCFSNCCTMLMQKKFLEVEEVVQALTFIFQI